MKAQISIKPARTAVAEARVLALKAKAAAEQARDAKILARLAKRRLKEARRDFKRARKASKQARHEAKEMQAVALAAARKQAAAARKPAAQKPRRLVRRPVEMAGADAAARTAATKPALDAKIKVEPEAGLRRKGAAQSVAPLPEKLARRLAQTADPAQGGSPAAVGGIAAKSAGGPVPAAPAQAGWPEEAGEPGA